MIDVSQDQLQTAVEGTHGCTATFREAVPVKETFDGQTVWEGAVHVFDVDHADASTCYAWSSPVEGSVQRKFYAVLSVSPIDSALDAVRAAIVGENR